MASHFSGKAGERVKLYFIQWRAFENGIRLFISDDFINLAGMKYSSGRTRTDLSTSRITENHFDVAIGLGSGGGMRENLCCDNGAVAAYETECF